MKKKGRRIDFIAMYDVNTDELITTFDSYKECASYFNTSVEAIICNVMRKNRKRYKGSWYRLIPDYRRRYEKIIK